MSQAILEVRDLSKNFGGVAANQAVSLEVPAGRIVGLIGPNGSGKTTLFNSIAGQHGADSGRVHFGGVEISGMGVEPIARLGLVRTFQQSHVFEGMTCLQNMQICVSHADEKLAAMLGRFPADVTTQALELLGLVGLSGRAGELAGNLSFGQRKLLEIAMALMNRPRLLLLDEPTAGVNPILVNTVAAFLRRANRTLGIGLLVIEHNMRFIMGMADYVYCMANGRVLSHGTPDQVRADPRVIDAYLGAR